MHFFQRPQLSYLAPQLCRFVATEALFLDRGQSTEYLEADKTYSFAIRCSLIAPRLLLCLRDNCFVKAYQC